MSVINTNITALIGQQNLGRSQSALQTSMERLSSGLRINSAKDDAAGQAIANRMTAQITGLQQAQRNANDGISLAQTAEGSLNQMTDNLQRIRELTVQAENGTNSADDLQSIQDEITQRLDEINRISGETSFNGVKVLAKDQGLQIQVGANDGESITVDLQKIDSAALSLTNFTVNQPSLSEAITVGSDGLTPITNNAGETLHEVLDDAGAGTGSYVIQDAEGNLFAAADNADSTVDFDYAGGNVDAVIKTVDDADGNTYNIRYANDGTEVVELQRTSGESFFATATDAATLDSTAPITPDDLDAFTGEVLSGTPLGDLDSALNQIDSLRSELGAVQNRFEDAITNLSTNSTNLSAARSRIEDADYAVEVSEMTRAQILQQAGTSVLAQANQVPQSVLSLLG